MSSKKPKSATKAKSVKPKTTPAVEEDKAVEVETRGRKTELNEEVLEKIMDNIRAGIPIKTAVAMAGVAERTYFNWMKRGSDEEFRISKGEEPNPEESLFLHFLQSATRAREEAKGAHVAVIAKAGARGDWRASAWWLSRQYRDEFGDNPAPQYQQINNTLNISVTLSEIERMLDALEARDNKVIDVETSN